MSQAKPLYIVNYGNLMLKFMDTYCRIKILMVTGQAYNTLIPLVIDWLYFSSQMGLKCLQRRSESNCLCFCWDTCVFLIKLLVCCEGFEIMTGQWYKDLCPDDPVKNVLYVFLVSRKAERDGQLHFGPFWDEHRQL